MTATNPVTSVMAISDALAAYSSTAEMNTAISDAIDSLNLSQYQNATDVQFLIDQAPAALLGPDGNLELRGRASSPITPPMPP